MPTYDPHKTPTEIRQGNRRRMNLRILFGSMIGLVLLFSLIYLYFVIVVPPAS